MGQKRVPPEQPWFGKAQMGSRNCGHKGWNTDTTLLWVMSSLVAPVTLVNFKLDKTASPATSHPQEATGSVLGLLLTDFATLLNMGWVQTLYIGQNLYSSKPFKW